MDALNGEYNFTRLERVIFGPGKVAALRNEVERRGLGRAVVVTGKTLGGSKLLDKVTGALGPRCASVFKGARQHVPSGTVKELAAEMRRVDADCVVSFGGGSPIDTAKAAAASILGIAEAGLARQAQVLNPSSTGGIDIVHIAIPTTLSAGEYTPVGGMTNETTRVKGGVADSRLQPRTIINDPELTLETPDWLWVSTGMRALDHAVEGPLSNRHQLVTDTLASKAIALLFEHLPASIRLTGADRIAHRGYCQMAAWLSVFGATNTRMGISHALGHQIGPRWDVPHGVTSCITLPHVMRYMADLAPERFAPIAQGLGIHFDFANPRAGALECADRVARFIGQFDVPHSLKDAGVSHDEISQIAGTVHEEVSHIGTLDRPATREEIVALLEAAYGE